MSEGLRAQRLVALFVAGWLLFNFPLLALWGSETVLAGVPLLPAALFGLWALLIAAVAWVAERGGGPAQDSP
jgi:hypothetical protein